MKTKSLLSTASLVLAIAAFSASAQAQIAIGHLAGLFRRHLRRRHALWPGRRRHLCVGQQEWRRRRQAAQRRYQRLRLPGAEGDRALQEMVGAGRQGRGDHGLGHRRYRGADRLPRPGQDPRHVRLLRRSADRSRRHQRQGQARAVQFLLWPELFGFAARHADLGGRGLEGQGQARQAEIRAYGRQPSLSERAEGCRRSHGAGARLRGAAAAGVRAGAGRLQRAVPEPEEHRAPITPISATPRPPTSR